MPQGGLHRRDTLDRSVRGLDGAPEWPSIQALLPPLRGRRVADLGCGFGWFARWARTQGASYVLGLDISENMLARAKAETGDGGVDYAKADLEQLDLPPGGFDLVYSSLTFHYIEDFGRLVRTVFQALRPGGHFVFTIEHPIYMASTSPGWMTREDGQRAWAVDSYAVEGARITDWLAKGVVKQHRTLATTLNTLIGSGFAIRGVDEWSPTPAQLAERPSLADEMNRPMMVLIAAQR